MTRREIRDLARRFARGEGGSPWARGERALKARLRRRRGSGVLYLTRDELVWLGEWKTPRVRPWVARNTSAGVRGVTAAAFLARDESLRVRLLTALPGVGLAVASVVLHFADPRRYPVYDVRVRTALGRLGLGGPFPPTAEGWIAYTECLRGLSRRYRLSLRTLDKALWLVGGPAALQSRAGRAILDPP